MDREGLDSQLASAVEDVLFDVTHLSMSGGEIGFRGKATICQHEVLLRVELGADFPLSLPRIYLLTPHPLGQLPHVITGGFICYLPKENAILDRNRPADVVRDALLRTCNVLEQGVTGENRWDLVDELQTYWRIISRDKTASSTFDPGDQAILLDVVEDQKGCVWLSTNLNEYVRLSRTEERRRHLPKAALYLPVVAETFIEPPTPEQRFWTEQQVRDLVLPRLSLMDQGRLRSLRRRTVGTTLRLVVGIPRRSGGHALIGIQFDGVDDKHHPLAEGGSADSTLPFFVERFDQDLLIGRAGGRGDLRRKSALVVGAGSVGSRVAAELAQAGFGNLTIADSDTFNQENTFRHYLGRLYWGYNKAVCMKWALESELPYVQVIAVQSRIEEAVRLGEIDFSKFDLVVFAIGDPTIELAMNEVVMGLPNGPATVFAWLEPLGIGGHALLVRPGRRGCFECLYTANEPKPYELYNRASFAAGGQTFSKDLTGCGSIFTPYGSAEAAMTAAMAVKLAVDGMTGAEPGSPLRSWRGSAADFKNQGFKLSTRYNISEQDLIDRRYLYQSPNCDICSSYPTGNLGAD